MVPRGHRLGVPNIPLHDVRHTNETLALAVGTSEAEASRYDAVTSRQTTVRLPEELAAEAEAVARVKGSSVNALIVESLAAEIERVRADKDFTARAKRLLERDRELIERLAK